MKIKPISGNRVIIREHLLDDRSAYLDWQCDPDVGEFLNWLPRTEVEAYKSLLDAIEQQDLDDRRRYFMAVIRQEDEVVVGDVGVTLLNDRIGDIGWFIRKKYWGRGYGNEAAALMIDCGFREIGLATIRASCRIENSSSINIISKCGFQLTGASEGRLNYSLRSNDWIRRG